MPYIFPIKTAFLFFPFLALFFTIPFLLYQYHKYGSISFYRSLIVYSFIFYLITMYFLVILPLPNRSEVKYNPDLIKLVPFGFVKDIVRDTPFVWNNPSTYLESLKMPSVYTVVFNLFLTIPFGMYLRYYFQCNMKKTILWGFFLSLFFEVTQLSGLYFIYPYPYRVFDVDDLIINTLGAYFGFCIVGCIQNFLPSREEIDEKSFERAQVVSGLRRITIFFFDFFLWTIFLFFFSFVPAFFLWILYYIIFPYFFHGTLGSLFLKVKFEFADHRLLRITGRMIFLVCYYFLFPFIFLLLAYEGMRFLNLKCSFSSFFVLLPLSFLCLFYLIHLVFLLKKKRLFYDNLFQIRYTNTIQSKSMKCER